MADDEERQGMTYEVFSTQGEYGPNAPNLKMISVRLMSIEGHWVEVIFDKGSALEHGEMMTKLAATP